MNDIPVAQKPRRQSLKEQQTVEDQITEWLDSNIVRVSFPEYASPLVLVRKKYNSTRVNVDYRQLNRKIIKDEYPLPVIENLIDKLRDSKAFSVIALKNGVFLLKVSKESIHYTFIVTHHGQFEFSVKVKVKRKDYYNVEKNDVTCKGSVYTTCSADGMERWP